MSTCTCGTTKKVNTLCCDGVHRCLPCWYAHRESGSCEARPAGHARAMYWAQMGRISRGVLEFVAHDAWAQP